jgi:methylmalonyl-CoA epimerase
MISEQTPTLIHHIGVAVRSLSAARKVFQDALGIQLGGQEEVLSQKVRVEFYKIGDTRIECLEPTSEDSPIAKFLARKGEGIHHIGIQVPDVAEALHRARERGLEPIDHEPRVGAVGMKIAFLHPQSTGGILIELVEVS